jgi:hypothetical protein
VHCTSKSSPLGCIADSVGDIDVGGEEFQESPSIQRIYIRYTSGGTMGPESGDREGIVSYTSEYII